MTPDDFRRYLEMAARHGADYAATVARAEQDNGGEIDALDHDDFCRDAYGDDAGPCTQDDEFDSSGERYRPRVNDAGEPWWM